MKLAFSKTIESRTENLRAVRELIGGAAKDFGFSEEDSSKIALAVDEACTNIIRHAYHNRSDKNIEITVYAEKETFEVRIIDSGDSFDPEALKPVNLKEHLTAFRRGGLGVHLMKTLMDDVKYRSVSGRKNEVRLTKHLPQ
ncbi:MAG: ATP-binding protein [Ignavibacteria bacterium]|nr:ATP-binding protein [Ignavibacteria bacterium]